MSYVELSMFPVCDPWLVRKSLLLEKEQRRQKICCETSGFSHCEACKKKRYERWAQNHVKNRHRAKLQ